MLASSAALAEPSAPTFAAVRGERRLLTLAGVCCVVGAVLVTMWLWRDPASRIVAANSQDADQFAWFFRYDATAVAHLRLPALTTEAMNAPQGISVMWNTFMLLPGVLLAPVTLLAGPQVSLTVLMTIGFAGSAFAMFVVLRRWGASTLAASLGAAIYGFSPALIQSSLGHYDLQFAVLPPLIADAALRLVTGARTPVRYGQVRLGAWLGLLVAAQIFIAEEMLLDTALAVAVMVAVLAVSRRSFGCLRQTVVGLATAVIVTGIVAGYPLWVQFLGPLRQQSSPFTPDFYKNDLAGFVQPSSLLMLHTSGSAAFANAYQGNLPEYLAYLGWPMLIVLAVVAVRFWRLLPVRVTAAAFAVLSVLSLGGTLLAGGHEHAGITLPWYWLQTLPVTGSVLPDRFSIVADGAAAAAFAFGFDASRLRWPRAESLIACLAAIAIVPLIPKPLPVTDAAPVPAGWSATFAALRLPADAHVLVLPIPVATFTEPLRWQADTGQPGSMIGGYYMGRTWTGGAATDGNGLSFEAMYLNQLWAESAHVNVGNLATLPTNEVFPSVQQMDAQLRAWHVAAVVAVTPQGSALGRYLDGWLGRPAVHDGQLLAWKPREGPAT
jgi:hypothetical protein